MAETHVVMIDVMGFSHQHINTEAVIAPEISATVAVAVVFVINPVMGTSVFAANTLLALLWNKLSLIS